MKLVLKQRLFSWFDSYDVCDEYGNAVFSVKGRLAWGHLLEAPGTDGRKRGRSPFVTNAQSPRPRA